MVVEDVRLSSIVERLAEASMRAAAYMKYDLVKELLPLNMVDAATEIVQRVASQIAESDGVSLRCKLCGKGPYTRKGFYLHLKRVHYDAVLALVREELTRYIWKAKNVI